MQPNDLPTSTGSKPPSKKNLTRSALTLVVLVVIVGGIAWVVQYLPSRGRPVQPAKDPSTGKKVLAFERPVAVWRKKPATSNAVPAEGLENDPYKDVETGTSGHYDFLFKNLSGTEIEILFFVSTCDCASVKACVLPSQEWKRVNKEQEDKPGEPLDYATAPSWLVLPKGSAGEPAKKPIVVVGPDEGGAVRVEWIANKPDLNVQPGLAFRAKGDSTLVQPLVVPVKAKPPIQFDPPRVDAGVLTAGKSRQKVFDVWSSTRDKLDFTIVSADPLFVFESQQLVKDEFTAKAKDLLARNIARALCTYRVTLTVHESKDGKHLDQGSFYRKFPFALDGKVDPNATLWGPEIVGLVQGDIQIGGADDRRRILFKSFNVKTRASKEVQLAADANVKLKVCDGHPDQPAWVKVNLARDEKQASPNRVTWRLEVIVEPNAIGARSFEEPDAVVLQIVGTQSFVRIPIEGHISR
jgi:hypothetical protein